MRKFRVYPYKQGSRSAKALSIALGGKVLKHVGSKYRPRPDDVVINWGAGGYNPLRPATSLNTDVSVAANKLKAFDALLVGGVRVPPYAENRWNVEEILQFPVVCRTKLTGHSGEGIVIAENKDELVDAPLYTQYVKKKDEYRVHLIRDFRNKAPVKSVSAFFIQRKARKLDVENPNWKVRNLAGGFVFAECDFDEVPNDVVLQAAAALNALNLDFGGVDVIWNEREGKAYVLEVNTACGLEERTAQKYAEAILDAL